MTTALLHKRPNGLIKGEPIRHYCVKDTDIASILASFNLESIQALADFDHISVSHMVNSDLKHILALANADPKSIRTLANSDPKSIRTLANRSRPYFRPYFQKIQTLFPRNHLSI